MELIKKQDKSLGELLLQAGYVTKEQLDECLLEQKNTGEPLGKIMTRKRYVREDQIISVLKGLLTVVVEVNRELFGIEVIYTREIIKNRRITPLPDMPPCIRGIMSIREDVIPVVSLNRKIFGRADEDTDETRIIIIDARESLLGVVVDRVITVKSFQTSSFANITKYTFSVDKKYIAGLLKDGNDVITLLKPDILFEDGA
ncbi:MAG: chemotaxis protein CheW [Spirochaetia bacterium]|nr:chemotaxis protein CheW [Spirochaetia bacterium]